MATLIELYNLRYGVGGAELKNRIEMQLGKTAQYILIENPATANHAERLNWAKLTLRDPQTMVEKMHSAILTDATISANGAASTDLQIESAVAAQIDVFALAGV